MLFLPLSSATYDAMNTRQRQGPVFLQTHPSHIGLSQIWIATLLRLTTMRSQDCLGESMRDYWESHATSSHMAGNFTPTLIAVWSTFVSPFCSLATSHAGCLYSFLQDWAYVTFPPAMTSIRVTTRRWSRATCVCCTPRNMLHWSYLSSPSRPFWHGVKSAQGSFQTFSITQTQSSTTNFAFARQSNISEREDAPKFGHGSRGCMGNLFARKASYEIWFPASSLSVESWLATLRHTRSEGGWSLERSCIQENVPREI